MKISRGQGAAAFYGFMFIAIFFVISLGLTIYYYARSITIASLQATYPNIPLTMILYVIAALVVCMILLMLFNSQFEVYFQKRKSIGIDRPLPMHKLFWTPATTANPQDPHNLLVTSNEFSMATPETYSMGIELMISDTRTTDKFGPYRHLVHRGTDDLKKFTNDPGQKGAGDLNDGLPSQMNPGLFVDQFSNDLIIFVDTDPVGGDNQSYRESVRISDAPLNRAFYVHITVHDRLLEVYINCRLAATKLLHGTPRGVPNEWFGRIGFSRARAVIQNLKLWDDKLWAIEVRNMCTGFVLPLNMAPTGGCGSK